MALAAICEAIANEVAELKQAGLSGRALLQQISTLTSCHYCAKTVENIRQCHRCHGVAYCSDRCNDLAWRRLGQNVGPPDRQPPEFLLPHNCDCRAMERHQRRRRAVHNVLAYFPWGARNKQGVFPVMHFLAAIGLLGKNVVTFSLGPPTTNMVLPGSYKIPKKLPPDDWLNEDVFWQGLQREHIPTLRFDVKGGKNGRKPPERLRWKLFNWKQWHDWRGIPNESPVVLCMHSVMTVYNILIQNCALAPRPTGMPNKPFTILLVNVTSELSLLPTFCELCLLLPGYDFTLILCGSQVVGHHKVTHAVYPPSSVALRPSGLRYAAPAALGGSTLHVVLHTGATWALPPPLLDAAIALDATPQSYPASAIVRFLLADVPLFICVSSEWEIEAEVEPFVTHTLSVLANSPGHLEEQSRNRALQSALWLRLVKLCQRLDYEHWPVMCNCFMRPGQLQPPGLRVPCCKNAFVMACVVPKMKTALQRELELAATATAEAEAEADAAVAQPAEDA